MYFDDANSPAAGTTSEMLAARHRVVARLTDQVIWDWDLTRDHVVWSEGLCALFGYAPDEVKRAARAAWWAERVHPDDREAVISSLGTALASTAETWAAEYRFRRADGEYALVLDRCEILRERGCAVRVIGVMQDVSEGRATEAALRESRNQLAAVLSAIRDGIILHDASGRLMYANDAAAQALGYRAASELMAESSGELLGRVEVFDEDGRRLLPGEMPSSIALATGRSTGALLRLSVRSTGEERWSMVSATPVLDEEGCVRQVVDSFLDVTEIKRAEQSRRFLADAGALLAVALDEDATLERVAALAVPAIADHCAVHVRDDKGTIRLWAMAQRAPGSPVRENALGHPIEFAEDHAIARVLRGGPAELHPTLAGDALVRFAREPEQRARLEAAGYGSAMVVPVAAHGRVFAAITFATDVTGRRYGLQDMALAEDLARRAGLAVAAALRYREAREAVRVRDEFLSVASHELRTPLTALLLHVERLLAATRRGETLAPGVLAERITRVDAQVRRLVRLVDELLDVSRLTAGRLELDLEEVDLTEVVREVVETFRDGRAAAAIELRAPEPAVGRWDRRRIEQVVSNLVSNALKYGGGKPVEVSIDVAPREVRLRVRDQGMGIAPADQARIFERFERVASSRHYGGLGLGLWIVRQVVEALGGSVQVESAPGLGSIFTVSLPRA